MKLYIVRHGETEENVKKMFQGHIPGTLTENGIEQAKKIALRLKDVRIDALYSSDLARAHNTAKEIATYHDTKIILKQELREYFLGELQGKYHAEVGPIDWKNNPPKDAETKEHAFARGKQILDEIYAQNKDKTVVFVSHGGFIKVLISLIMNQDTSYIDRIGAMKNTSLTEFDFKEDKNHKIQLFNCVKHLD